MNQNVGFYYLILQFYQSNFVDIKTYNYETIIYIHY